MARGTKCKNCGMVIPSGDKECPNCNADTIDSMVKGGYNKRDNFYGSCELCGREGRMIEKKLEKGSVTFYRCFDCHEKESYKNYPISAEDRCKNEEKWTPEYRAYVYGLIGYRRKPLFYNRQPNEVMLNKLWLGHMKGEVNTQQRAFLQSYDLPKGL